MDLCIDGLCTAQIDIVYVFLEMVWANYLN